MSHDPLMGKLILFINLYYSKKELLIKINIFEHSISTNYTFTTTTNNNNKLCPLSFLNTSEHNAFILIHNCIHVRSLLNR